MERIDNNVAIRRKPRPIFIEKEYVIADLQRKLSLGEINPLKYLTGSRHIQCRHIQTCYRCTEIISTEESPMYPVCRWTLKKSYKYFSKYIRCFIRTFIRKLCFVYNQS